MAHVGHARSSHQLHRPTAIRKNDVATQRPGRLLWYIYSLSLACHDNDDVDDGLLEHSRAACCKHGIYNILSLLDLIGILVIPHCTAFKPRHDSWCSCFFLLHVAYAPKGFSDTKHTVFCNGRLIIKTVVLAVVLARPNRTGQHSELHVVRHVVVQCGFYCNAHPQSI